MQGFFPKNTFDLRLPFQRRPQLSVGGVFFCVLSLFSVVMSAQNPVFKATVAPKDVLLGTPFEVSFILEGAEGQRFTPPAFRPFKTAGGVSESRGFTIVNGRTSVRQVWTYTLEATQAGTFTLAPASVWVNGKQLNTQALNITVAAGAQRFKGGSIPAGNNGDVFIAGELSTNTAYPGQQVIWRLTLYTKVAIEGADLIALPDFNGFYSKERRRFDTRTRYETIRGKKYAVKTLHEECLFPQNTGALQIGQAQIRVGIEQAGTQGFLFGPKPVTLFTEPLTLSVKPLPEPVPEGFTGGVGRFSWTLDIDSTSLSTDDAATISVVLTGNGDARRFGPPKLQAPDEFELFEPKVQEEESYENMEELMFTKKLEYVMLPQKPGEYLFKPSMVYFDPDSNRYCTLEAPAITFNIRAGKNYTASPAIDTLPPPLAVERPHWSNRLTGLLKAPLLWTILGSVVIGWLVFWWGRRRKTGPLQPAPTPAIHPVAAPITEGYLEQIMRFSTTPEHAGRVLKSIQGYLLARLPLTTAQLTHEMVLQKLIEKGVTPIRAQALISIWQKYEMGAYAGHPTLAPTASDAHALVELLREIDKELN